MLWSFPFLASSKIGEWLGTMLWIASLGIDKKLPAAEN
jgi:hypothetical protein